MNDRIISVLLVSSIWFLFSACSDKPQSAVTMIEIVDGKSEGVLVGFGDITDPTPVPRDPDRAKHEIHLWHVGNGELKNREAEPTHMLKLEEYLKNQNFDAPSVRLHLYKQELDWETTTFNTLLNDVAKIGFAEVRTRFEGDFPEPSH